MDIHEIHIASGFSIRALRKLEKLGVLRVTSTKGHPETSRIRAALRRGNPLTAYQLLSLYKTPGLLKSIGLDAKQQMRADDLIEDLGNVKAEACPWAISANIPGAYSKEPDGIAELAAWVQGHIKRHADDYRDGKPYSYLAVRLLHDIPDEHIERNHKIVAQAMLQVRKSPLMQGYASTIDGKSLFHTLRATAENNFDL